jgi:hypothetical protein
MKYTMTSPCEKCPFRTDVPGYLTRARAAEIARSIERAEFPCHETTVPIESDDESDMVEGPNAQHCAGALIMLEKMQQPSQMMRICERIGMYDASKLKMDSPVFEDSADFISHHGARQNRSNISCATPRARTPTAATTRTMAATASSIRPRRQRRSGSSGR